jgi:hypothetical protein
MAAAAVAAGGPDAAPTFNWTGLAMQDGPHIVYQSFNFAGQAYSVQDCVYLLPEEEGSAPYIARIVKAYEDQGAHEAERLVIEVRLLGGRRVEQRQGPSAANTVVAGPPANCPQPSSLINTSPGAMV